VDLDIQQKLSEKPQHQESEYSKSDMEYISSFGPEINIWRRKSAHRKWAQQDLADVFAFVPMASASHQSVGKVQAADDM
jgi:hypothetical protein